MRCDKHRALLLLWLLLAVAPHLWQSFGMVKPNWLKPIYKLPWNELSWAMFARSHRQIEIQRVHFLSSGKRESLAALVKTPALGYRQSRLIDNTTNKHAYRRHLCQILQPETRLETEIWRRREPVEPGQPSYRLIDIRHECSNGR